MDKHVDQTDWNAVDTLTDEAIAIAVATDPDAAPLNAEGLKRVTSGGRPRLSHPKKALSVRYDPHVINYFKATGKGWQTRMNDVLLEYIKTH